MERSEWLKKMRSMAEVMYDHISPAYWVKFGNEPDQSHRKFMDKFLGHMASHSTILDAACGAGLYADMLLEAGHAVLGIDQSAGMLAQARQHYPQEQFPKLHYLKIGLQDMNFEPVFNGVICMDAIEHICPEDWPVILAGFHQALMPGGMLYLTVDALELGNYRESYERAKAMGLPVVFGEQVDELDETFLVAMESDALDVTEILGERLDHTVYHYHPSMEQVHTWMDQVGFTVAEEASGKELAEEWYFHVLARKNP